MRVGRVQGDRFVLNGRPYPLRHGARPGLLAGDGLTRAGRRRAAPRRRAGQGDGLQRRAQAPEDRGPALPLLGRPAGPVGLGGDAQRLPLHTELGRAARRASGPRRSRATSATRASSRGCRSTSRGACPTCPTARPQRHYVQALYHLTKTLDPTRPVIGNDGWESVAHRHHRHPRLRRRSRARSPRRYARRRAIAAAVQARAAGRTRAAARGHAARGPARDAHRVRRHRASRGRAEAPGATPRANAERDFASATPRCWQRCARCRCSPASATRSSPTPIRKPTACCTQIARPEDSAGGDCRSAHGLSFPTYRDRAGPGDAHPSSAARQRSQSRTTRPCRRASRTRAPASNDCVSATGSPAAAVLAHALEQSGFVWLTGIEDTFITASHPLTGRSLDEYELTGHYRAWASDLELMATLGVSAVRYGIPWHRINPAPHAWDFTWLDEPIGRLLELGIEPVVDLVHYGVPAWIENAFLNPDYPQLVGEYAARVAERVRGRVQSFTPLNEPRITAWYTGKLGFWPPYQRGWSGFLRVLAAVCRGIIETERQLRAAIPELLSVHVDAADLYAAAEPQLLEEATQRQSIGFLALDLVSGRVDEAHPLRRWVERHCVTSRELDAFLDRPARPDVIGLNLYPLFSKKVLKRTAGRLRIAMPYGEASLVEALCRLFCVNATRVHFDQ